MTLGCMYLVLRIRGLVLKTAANRIILAVLRAEVSAGGEGSQQGIAFVLDRE